MRTVLVPLDGTEMAATIIPDARRLAGPEGQLILVRDAGVITYGRKSGKNTGRTSNQAAEAYLDAIAQSLREDGVRVGIKRLAVYEPASAIEMAADYFHVDMIACATHGRGPLERLMRGSVAWKALAHSHVPVLLRHPEDAWETGLRQAESPDRRILVPLDGSAFSETALPLAEELARQWKAAVWLVQVISGLYVPDSPSRRWETLPNTWTKERDAAQTYLAVQAGRLSCEVHTEAVAGTTVMEALIEAVDDWGITDVVMASHGRTGLARVILGSVADELIQRLHLPIIVIPALAAQAMHDEQVREEQRVRE